MRLVRQEKPISQEYEHTFPVATRLTLRVETALPITGRACKISRAGKPRHADKLLRQPTRQELLATVRLREQIDEITGR
jgi:hypothetical protein